jgi:Cu/Zn superoxide dismutase
MNARGVAHGEGRRVCTGGDTACRFFEKRFFVRDARRAGKPAIFLLGAVALTGCVPATHEQGESAGTADRAESPVHEDGGAYARAPRAGAVVARAQMRPLGEGTARGTIEFRAGASGGMTVNVMMLGLVAGAHAVHVQATGDCTLTAGGAELNRSPSSTTGDPGLGNVTAEASGIVHATLSDTHMTFDAGLIGQVVVVRAAPDQLIAQPGGTGAAIACGVIETAGGRNVDRSGRAPRRLNA